MDFEKKVCILSDSYLATEGKLNSFFKGWKFVFLSPFKKSSNAYKANRGESGKSIFFSLFRGENERGCENSNPKMQNIQGKKSNVYRHHQ